MAQNSDKLLIRQYFQNYTGPRWACQPGQPAKQLLGYTRRTRYFILQFYSVECIDVCLHDPLEIFFVCPHAYAWRLKMDTEPPCVSMRVDASISANRVAGTAY
jgi:hypothetical protein